MNKYVTGSIGHFLVYLKQAFIYDSKNIRNKNRMFIESKLYMIPKILYIGINTGYLEYVNGVI